MKDIKLTDKEQNILMDIHEFVGENWSLLERWLENNGHFPIDENEFEALMEKVQ